MFKSHITEYKIYRWRYFIGYGMIAIGLIAVLIFAGLYLPGGVSNQEIQSVVQSDAVNVTNLQNLNAINLPYHLLQQAVLAIFGVSIISIKIPSIILAFLSAVGIVLLLRRWFKPSVGVLASLIAITTGQFLFIAQDGTSGIMYQFWPIFLILIASLISSQERFRKFFVIAFCAIAALSLYTPLSIYMFIAFTIAALLHPHLRYTIRKIPRIQIVIGGIIFLILISPLAFLTVKTPNILLELLGIPAKWPDLGANIALIGNQYFGFMHPGGSTIMTPFFELGSMIIIAIGIYYIIRNRETSKSYTIAAWMFCLIPVLIFNPSYTSVAFVPLILLLASGLNALLSHWYGLFPHNPYARVGGLIPLVILVSALVFSGVDRYAFGYKYDPGIVPNFSQDLNLIPSDTKNIVVTDNELPFYKVLAKHNKQFVIETSPSSDVFLATHEAKSKYGGYVINKIIATSNRENSDRFYLYKKITD